MVKALDDSAGEAWDDTRKELEKLDFEVADQMLDPDSIDGDHGGWLVYLFEIAYYLDVPEDEEL